MDIFRKKYLKKLRYSFDLRAELDLRSTNFFSDFPSFVIIFSLQIFLLLSGEDDVSGVRVMDNGRKDTLRKGTVDSYIMKTKR